MKNNTATSHLMASVDQIEKRMSESLAFRGKVLTLVFTFYLIALILVLAQLKRRWESEPQPSPPPVIPLMIHGG